jgi:hypothetical protein
MRPTGQPSAWSTTFARLLRTCTRRGRSEQKPPEDTLSETCISRKVRRVSRYGTSSVPKRSERCRMGSVGEPPALGQAGWSTAVRQHSPHRQWPVLPRAFGLCLALSAARLWPVVDGLNGLITNDKFCWTRRGALSLSWPRSHPLPPDWKQQAAKYAPPDDRVYRQHRGGRHASSPRTPMAPAPSADSSLRRTAALGSGVSAPHAVDSAVSANPASVRTGGGRQP